jgi:hypothetical protein
VSNKDIQQLNTDDVLKEINEAFYDIPFSNSTFQTEAFVIASQVTPERAYRTVGLNLLSKVQTLKDFEYNKQLVDIKLEELRYQIDNEDISIFEKRRKEIEINRILDGADYQEKLKNDAIVELNVLYSHFKKMPKYTRAQFEAGEKHHYEQLMHRKLKGITSETEALINIEEDLKAITNFENAYHSLPDNEKSLQLENLSNEVLTNKLQIVEPESINK